jgi:hypothetical protein
MTPRRPGPPIPLRAAVRWWPAMVAALLGACALAAGSAPPPASAVSDCQFRSPTSCWTLGPRYPDRRPAAVDSAPPILGPPPAVLASTADSIR